MYNKAKESVQKIIGGSAGDEQQAAEEDAEEDAEGVSPAEEEEPPQPYEDDVNEDHTGTPSDDNPTSDPDYEPFDGEVVLRMVVCVCLVASVSVHVVHSASFCWRCLCVLGP